MEDGIGTRLNYFSCAIQVYFTIYGIIISAKLGCIKVLNIAFLWIIRRYWVGIDGSQWELSGVVRLRGGSENVLRMGWRICVEVRNSAAGRPALQEETCAEVCCQGSACCHCLFNFQMNRVVARETEALEGAWVVWSERSRIQGIWERGLMSYEKVGVPRVWNLLYLVQDLLGEEWSFAMRGGLYTVGRWKVGSGKGTGWGLGIEAAVSKVGVVSV
jgi:hypothetical protein